jgi:hypothetical protein
MSTQAKPGIGCVVRRLATEPIDSTTGVWKVFGEVTAISWGGASREVIETFKLNNEDDYVNKLQGVLNAGSVSLSINYTREHFFDMKAQMETRGNDQFQIELPDGEALEWEGFITELPLDMGSDDVMQGEVTIEIDGKPEFVSAATV